LAGLKNAGGGGDEIAKSRANHENPIPSRLPQLKTYEFQQELRGGSYNNNANCGLLVATLMRHILTRLAFRAMRSAPGYYIVAPSGLLHPVNTYS
jgi:hypothetical protein